MSDDKKLTIMGHLHELRQRLLKSVIAVVIASGISFVFAKQIFHILILPTEGIELIFIEMTEMIGTYVRVCLASGIIVAMPYLVFHLIIFVSPALTSKEKRYIYLVVPFIALMFAVGVVFGYFLLIPPAMKFLITFGSDIATPQIKIANYISIVTRLLLAVGIVFELPVITTFLSRLGVITSKWLSDKRKPAFILAFILAAIITPTIDPVNQCFVAFPLIGLYEISILLARLVQRREPRVVTSAPTATS